MKRLILVFAFVLSSVPASAQLTTMPIPLAQWFDNNGAVLTSGGLCVFRAGTSTLATTYTTAAGAVANANPVLFSSGRPSSGGVFLTPGESYKFVLKDFDGVVSPTCVPDTGSTIWTVDNIQTVPASSVNIDVPGTAGVSFTAGDVAYLSDGSGSLTAGSWYKVDADLSYAGVLPVVGFAVTDITSGAAGSFRIQGRVTGLSGLTPGADYYVSGTAGELTATAPVLARLVGRAESATALIVAPNPRTTPIKPRAPCGRLTLTTGTPVTTADVTAATTLYYAPYGGCSNLTLYDGTAYWYQMDFAQVSIAVPASTTQMYDVFAYDNAGTLTLELTAWSNDSTRATALTTQNGVYVKTGATTRLYLGSFRTTGVSGQTEDSIAKRFVWNYYHRVPRLMRDIESTNSWTYTTATWREANAPAENRLQFVVGVAEVELHASVIGAAFNGGGAAYFAVGIGLDSTTAPTAGNVGMFINGVNNSDGFIGTSSLRVYPAAGFHYAAWLEISTTTTGTTTWAGDTTASGAPIQSGIHGTIEG